MRSTERVRDLGEVFTPGEVVDDMLDMLPDEMWACHPSPTFLEPSAGDGNFLVAILERKLDGVAAEWSAGRLPAGDGTDALELHGLEALSAIYGVDISPENVEGPAGQPEFGARGRLLNMFSSWYAEVTGATLTSRSVLLACAGWIVERNVLVANMLEFDADARPTERDRIPLVEYVWDPGDGTVSVTATTLGDVQGAARLAHGEQASLFDGLEPPQVTWKGKTRDLRDAAIAPPSAYEGPIRNGVEVA